MSDYNIHKTRRIKCSRCRKYGHNIRTCSNDPWRPPLPPKDERITCTKKKDRIKRVVCFGRQEKRKNNVKGSRKYCTKNCKFYESAFYFDLDGNDLDSENNNE